MDFNQEMSIFDVQLARELSDKIVEEETLNDIVDDVYHYIKLKASQGFKSAFYRDSEGVFNAGDRDGKFYRLIESLHDNGYHVSIATNGIRIYW